MTGSVLRGESTSVELSATSENGTIFLESANRLTARAGGVRGIHPSLALEADNGSVTMSGSTIIGESSTIRLATATTAAAAGASLDNKGILLESSAGSSIAINEVCTSTSCDISSSRAHSS